ncbi:MAG: DUF948 domain-containing protein [Firmicutes bacterium]|nr:DUF948 domain-containing protein [Bacillota bacterium]
MSAWELIVIVAGLAFTALCVYLILVLRKLSATLVRVNQMLDENTPGVNDIVKNVGHISGDVGVISTRAKDAVEKISSSVENVTSRAAEGGPAAIVKSAMPDTSGSLFRTAVSVAGVFFTAAKVLAKMSENAKTKKLIKELKRSRGL